VAAVAAVLETSQVLTAKMVVQAVAQAVTAAVLVH
jgi:hypothetical protein